MTVKEILQEIDKLSLEDRTELYMTLYEWKEADELEHDDSSDDFDMRSVETSHGSASCIFSKKALKMQLALDFQVTFDEMLNNTVGDAKVEFEKNRGRLLEACARYSTDMFIDRVEDALAYMLVDHAGRVVLETIRDFSRRGFFRLNLTDGQLIKNFQSIGNKFSRTLMTPAKQGRPSEEKQLLADIKEACGRLNAKDNLRVQGKKPTRTAVARILGRNPSDLGKKLRDYGIDSWSDALKKCGWLGG